LRWLEQVLSWPKLHVGIEPAEKCCRDWLAFWKYAWHRDCQLLARLFSSEPEQHLGLALQQSLLTLSLPEIFQL
jgi:hypothetical protein